MNAPKHIRTGNAFRNIYQQTLGGLATKHPIAKTVSVRIGELFDHRDNIDNYLGSIEKRPDYSHLNDAGKLAARRKAMDPVLRDRVKVQNQLEVLAKTLHEVKPRLKPRDKTDVTGEMRDAEMRAHVKAMKPDERMVGKMSPEMLAAVARAPAALSGLLDTMHNRIQERVIEQENPGALDSWRAAEESFHKAAEVLKGLDKDFADASGFNTSFEYERYVADNIVPAVSKEKPLEVVVDPVTGNPPDHQSMLDALARLDRIEAEALAESRARNSN